MKNFLVALSFCLMVSEAYGTRQIPEKVLYKGQEYRLACVPLEKYFDANHPKPVEFKNVRTDCVRGYVGTWEIKDKKLYLRSLERPRRDPPEEIPLSLVFKDYTPPIEATWYTGVLRMPYGQKIRWVSSSMIPIDEDLYVGVSYGASLELYEKDIYLRIVDGNIVSEYVVDNKAEGATHSVQDWGWVASGSGPVKDDFKWHDFRDVVSDGLSQYKESGKPFRTRCVYWEDKKRKKEALCMPATPVTEPIGMWLKSMPENYTPKTGEHLEINAHFEKEVSGYSLHVDSVRPLKPGETMHHPDFKPPDKPLTKPAEKTR